MASALPIAKLAGLLVKTLAKPVSKRIKHEFNRTAATRHILHSIGQASHQVTSRFTIWSAGYKVRHVTPLEAEAAMKIGSEFVGESFVLIVSAGTVLWEYNRSKIKDEKKAALKLAEAAADRQALQEQLHLINVRLLALEGAEIMEGHAHHHGHHRHHASLPKQSNGTSSLWNPLWSSVGGGAAKATTKSPLQTTPASASATSQSSSATNENTQSTMETKGNASSDSSENVASRDTVAAAAAAAAASKPAIARNESPESPVQSPQQSSSSSVPSSSSTSVSTARHSRAAESDLTATAKDSTKAWWNLWGLW